MIAFGTEEIDPEQKVVNPEYRRIDHRLKKVREKKQRLEAKFWFITKPRASLSLA